MSPSCMVENTCYHFVNYISALIVRFLVCPYKVFSLETLSLTWEFKCFVQNKARSSKSLRVYLRGSITNHFEAVDKKRYDYRTVKILIILKFKKVYFVNFHTTLAFFQQKRFLNDNAFITKKRFQSLSLFLTLCVCVCLSLFSLTLFISLFNVHLSFSIFSMLIVSFSFFSLISLSVFFPVCMCLSFTIYVCFFFFLHFLSLCLFLLCLTFHPFLSLVVCLSVHLSFPFSLSKSFSIFIFISFEL